MTTAVETSHLADMLDLPRTDGERPKAPPRSSAAFKVVPQERPVRDQIRAAAAEFAKPLDRSRPFTRPMLQQLGEALLKQHGHPDEYLGFTMVCIANEFWREQVQAIPFNRRLLLLPHCLKNAEGCPADYDEFGLDCRVCGACSVADFKTRAEDLGYKVLVTEGTPIVLKIIVSGHVDAIVGVACLNVLEKAIDKILLAGIPCVAAPLLSSNCKSTSVDNDWVFELVNLQTPAAAGHDQDLRPPDAGGLRDLRGAGAVSAWCPAARSRRGQGRRPARASTKPSPTTGSRRAASVRGRSSPWPPTTP